MNILRKPHSFIANYGMPRGTFAQYLFAFGTKRKLHCIFLGGKGDCYYIQTRHNDLSAHYNLFLRKF